MALVSTPGSTTSFTSAVAEAEALAGLSELLAFES